MAIDKEKQYKRQTDWKRNNKDRIAVEVPKGTRDIWRAQAKADGLSLNEWIIKKCQG